MAGIINQRSSGLIDSLHNHVIHILGCGAIGSSAATQLCRMGAENFVLYDMDKVETANIGVSEYYQSHIGQNKTSALKSILMEINPDCSISEQFGLFNTYQYHNQDDIIILGFDNMKSRLEAIEICLDKRLSKDFKPRLIIDGRMGAEHYQQYTFIHPQLRDYLNTWYSDEEGDPEPCSAKATSYCSNMSGSFIVNQIRKAVTGQSIDEEFYFNFPQLILAQKGQ